MPANEAVQAFNWTFELAAHLPRWQLRLWRCWLQQQCARCHRDTDIIRVSALSYVINHYAEVHVARRA